jgi:hypothetical protein
MKHKFLNDGELLNELRRAFEKNGRLIIAYDFDNTVHPSGKINREGAEEVQNLLKRWRPYATFICYTANIDILKVYRYIVKNDIPCDAVNENPPETLRLYSHYGYTRETAKPYANIYLDDKAGLREAYLSLEALLNEIEVGDKNGLS